LWARARGGLRCEGVISTSFGCPYEGASTPRACSRSPRACVTRLRRGRLRRHDRHGQPAAGARVLHARARELGDVELTAHFHNTRGQGLANVLAALEAGVTSFESSFGELGGCPVPAGATGNIASRTSSRCCTRWASRPASTLLDTIVAGPVDWHG
jgi:hydroxymethylglutaryl-CoA lyase